MSDEILEIQPYIEVVNFGSYTKVKFFGEPNVMTPAEYAEVMRERRKNPPPPRVVDEPEEQ